jgi:MFS family permease
MFSREQKRLLILSSLGGVLEYYDFIIYALLASYISKAFFPTGNAISSLMVTFATFSVGYLARPIGGILFGHFGDKLGRKATFTISILIMAISTFFMALVPTYASIGIAAPIIVIIFRICQGLSVGGEIPGAIAYVSESISVNRKSLACGIIFSFLINGIVLGALVQAIITSVITTDQMQIWGWRIPFILGGIFGFMSYLLRRKLEESALFRNIQDKIVSFPLITVFKQKSVNAISAIFIVGLGASIISGLFLFIPAYFNAILHFMPPTAYIWQYTAAMFICSILCIISSAIADKLNHKIWLFILAIMSIILAYPAFHFYSLRMNFYLFGLLIAALLTGLLWGVIPSLLSELFPTKIRYTGIAVSYNVGFAVFGGLTPLISTLIIYKTGSVTAPAIYLIITSLLAIVALLFVKTKKLDQ